MQFIDLPRQPSIFVSYWNVGKLLYGALFLFVLETIFYYAMFQKAYMEKPLWVIGFWLWSLMFSFIHIFLVSMDIWSRIQNYKRFKDHLFQHGFSPKIVDYYKGSKCQRMALTTAAKELGIEDKIKEHFRKSGIKWFHFVPQFMIQDPLFPFKKHFWSRTFLEKYYEPKFQFRNPHKIPADVRSKTAEQIV